MSRVPTKLRLGSNVIWEQQSYVDTRMIFRGYVLGFDGDNVARVTQITLHSLESATGAGPVVLDQIAKFMAGTALVPADQLIVIDDWRYKK